MKYIFIIIILLGLPVGFTAAVTPVNGGPAQVPEQHVMQPPPAYTSPNVSGNADFQANLNEDNTPESSSGTDSADQGDTIGSQNGLGGVPKAGSARSFWWVALIVFVGLIATVIWRSLKYKKVDSDEKK
jgi:hypothetical protein